MADIENTIPLAASVTIPLVFTLAPLLGIILLLSSPNLLDKFARPTLALPSLSNRSNQQSLANDEKSGGQTRDPVQVMASKKSSTSITIKPLLETAQAITNHNKKLVRREEFGIAPRPSQESEASAAGLRNLFAGKGSKTSGSTAVDAHLDPAQSTEAKEELQQQCPRWVSPFRYCALMAVASVTCGVVYLNLSGQSSSKALEIALGLSLTLIPIFASFSVILSSSKFKTSSSISHLLKSGQHSDGYWMALSAAATISAICFSVLGAYVSCYIPLGVSAFCLLVFTAATVSSLRRAGDHGAIKLPVKQSKRSTTSFFSGQILNNSVLSSKRGRQNSEPMEMIRENSWLSEYGRSFSG